MTRVDCCIKLLVNSVYLITEPPGLPQIEGYRSGDQISAFDTLTLACLSRGGNPLARLVWYKDGQLVDSSYASSEGKESTNTYSLVVKPEDNNAEVTCKANNPALVKPLSSSVKLMVLCKLIIMVEHSNIRHSGGDH